MIKEISISNYRGLSSKFNISFVANSKNRRKDKYGVVTKNHYDILLAIALLGKNGSGKTSIVQAINFLNILCSGTIYNNILRRIERRSNIQNKELKNVSKAEVINFLHNQEFNNPKKPIDFYICFIDAKREIKLNVLIKPNGDVWETITENGKIIEHQENPIEKYKSKIFDIKFSKVQFIMLGEMEENIPFFSFKHFFENKALSNERILNWIRIADDKIVDIDINDGYIDSFKIKGFDNEIKKIGIFQLSSGTYKWLNMMISILPALLNKQSFLFFDEIEKSLHPKLVLFIIKCFNNRSINKKKSQLFFTTHSPNIVDAPFRKDAINYFAENNVINIAKEFNIREDVSFSKNYYSQKLSSHPSAEEMFDFLESLTNE